MAEIISFSCFDCHKVFVIEKTGSEPFCPKCQGRNGVVLTPHEVARGIDHGTYFNIDLNTGKAKRKKR
jgi:hypothetical protein